MDKTIKINCKLYKVVTLTELATMCNVTTTYIRKLEYRDIIRGANIRGKERLLKNGDNFPGPRYYTIELAEKIKIIFSEFKQGVAVTPDQKRRLAIAFQEEQQTINIK